ncbi:MAG: transglycosylase domain-containing protein [Bacilli bacterium]|nr:transglycosylase domain-containing protein [Bacilli bacterium]
MKKGFKKFMFNNSTNLLIAILSIITLVIGGITIGWGYAIALIAVLDGIWFIPPLIKQKKNSKPKTYHVNKDGDTMKKKKKTDKKKKSVGKKILLGILIAMIVCFALGLLFMLYIAIKAPTFDPDKLYHQESTIVYNKDGKVFAKLGAEKREIIKYNQMSESLINAIVATEDSRFFKHNGFDLPRFAVASAKQLLGKSSAGGASTLTMQVVKNHFTSTEDRGIKGVIRKFTDIYMSIFQVEKNYSKEEILEFYANSNYLGGGAYGVEQASLNYFGKHAKDLNIAESSLIAGLFNAPNSLDPYNHPDRAEKRRKTVLYLMERHGYITKEEKKEAEKLTVDKILIEKQVSDSTKYQSFLDTVASDVNEATGHDPYSVAMEIYTTMDQAKQDSINEIMSGAAYKWDNEVVNAGITVLDVKTGALVAVGGGRNKTGAKSYNTATMTKRQIGSTAKPLYDYAPGMEFNNWSTYTPFVDEPYKYSDGTSIKNYDGQYKGFLTSREAITDSRNIPALKAFQQNKNSNVKKFVLSLGLSPELGSNGVLHEAHAIGGYNGESPLTLSAAYTAFASGGYYVKPYSFTKVKYRNSDKTYENKSTRTKVMSDSTAYMMTDILVSTAKAFGRYADVNGLTYAGKTGTTNFSEETKKANGLSADAINDLWCVGYNPNYSIAVWYGYDKIYKDHYTHYGSRENVRLFQAVAKKIFSAKDGNFTRPDSVKDVTVEYGTNPAKLPSDGTPDNLKKTELFKAGTEPTEISTTYLKLQNVSGLTGNISDKKVSLSWNKAAGITSMNTSTYGELGYNVYKKENGNLTLLKFVTTNSFSTTLGENDTSATYVVKTTYANKKDYESSGSEITLTAKKVSAPTFSLDGKTSDVASVGSPYTDPGVIVMDDGALVASSKYTVTKTIKNSTGAEFTGTTLTATAGTYTIRYTIKYSGVTDSSLVRTVIVS